MSEVRGGEGEGQPHVQGERLQGCRRAERSYSRFKVRRGYSSKVRSSSCTLLGKL